MELSDYPDWDGLKKDVNDRIDILRAVWEKADLEIKDSLMRNLIIPCLACLADFCASVQLED